MKEVRHAFYLLIYLISIIAGILADTVMFQTLVFLAVFTVAITAGVKIKSLGKVALLSTPFLLLISFFQWLGQEGWQWQMFSIAFLRAFTLIISSLWLIHRLSPLELAQALVYLLYPLRKIIPLNDIALVFSLSLNFIPLLISEYQHIKEARFVLGLPSKGARVLLESLIPLIASALNHAESLSEVLEVKRPITAKPSFNQTKNDH